MKILLALSLIFYTVNGFSFSNIFSHDEEIKPLASCTGVADGTRLPDETNCQKFTLCDQGNGLLLSCRTSEPHFYRCNSTCVADQSVCLIKECPGDTTTTSTTTTSTTTTSTTTTPTTTTSTTTTPTTTTSTTTTTPTTTTTGTTTTRFSPPTVPVSLCKPACSTTFPTDASCTCKEQWVCQGTTCVCDTTIRCPTSLAVCEDTVVNGGCGCKERCSCTGTAPNEKCNCNEKVICPFDKADCADICDCDGQCDDTVCKADASATSGFLCTACNTNAQCSFAKTECVAKCGCANNCVCPTDATCTCNATCSCIEPPVVCPFKPSDCVSRCGCDQRCANTCNGDFCVCDPLVACT